jgi:hypothetical protein
VIRAWGWLRRNAVLLLGGVALLLGAYLLWRRHKGEIASLKDALKVERTRREIAVLQEQRRALVARDEAAEGQIEVIDVLLAENRRAAVENAKRVRGMTDDEVEQEFSRLGL